MPLASVATQSVKLLMEEKLFPVSKPGEPVFRFQGFALPISVIGGPCLFYSCVVYSGYLTLVQLPAALSKLTVMTLSTSAPRGSPVVFLACRLIMTKTQRRA